MPQYSIQGPDGKTYSIEGPEGATREEVIDAIEYKMRQQPAKPEESSFGRQLLDVPVQAGKGVATGVRMLSDIFGAANPVSQALSGVEDYMDSLLSAQAKNDQKEISRIMAEAEDKGVADKVIAGAKAFATAPVDLMSQALGTAVPTIAGGLIGSLAKIGALGVRGIQAGIGAATGAGAVKGNIYEAVKDALIDAGESPDVAEYKASEAQAYTGENWGFILGGTALGAVAGSTGIEKMIVGRYGAKKAAEQSAKGIGRRALEGGVTEFGPEFVQAAQEQVAANLALQKEGFDVDTFRGAIEQGTLEGLAGLGLGAGFGALGPGRRAEPAVTPPTEPQVVSTKTYTVTDFDGNPARVTVTQDDVGNVIATDEKGEEVDLTNVVSKGVSVEDAVKTTFSPEDAPAPVMEEPVTPKPPVAAPPVTPPVVQPEVAAQPEVTAPEIAPPEIPQAPAVPEPPLVAEPPVAEEPVAPEAPVAPPVEAPIEPPVQAAPEAVAPPVAEVVPPTAEVAPPTEVAPPVGRPAPSEAAKRTSDFIDQEVSAYGPPPARETEKGALARRINETKAAWKKYQAFAKDLPPDQRFNEGQFKMVFDRRRRAYEAAPTAAPVAPPPVAPPAKAPTVELPMAPSEAEEAGRISATPSERKVSEKLAEEMLGEVVWQDGKTAMLRVADPKYGQMRYIVAVGRKKTATDIRQYTGTLIDPRLKSYLRDLAGELEAEATRKHNANPYVKFSQGISVSEDIDPKIEGILRGWRKELGMNAKIHITTLESVKRNRNKYTGPHRSIIGGALNPSAQGYMQKWSDGNYYIVFTKSTSPTRMLETIAHELGHIHQREVFERADPATKREITAAYNRWLTKNKVKNVKDYLHSLRAKTTAQITTGEISEEGLARPSMGLTPYWRSFSEWYADQVSRWAVTDEKPVGIVEQFFSRLGQALRKFYKTLKGQGYLPDETFVQYLNKIKARAQILPATSGEASSIESEALNQLEPDIEFSEILKKLPPGRSVELTQAANDFADGRITSKEFNDLVDKYRPIVVSESVPRPNTESEMKNALNEIQREKVNPQIAENTPVGTRLDIKAAEKGVPVVTIHTKRPGGPNSKSVGTVIGFKSVAKLRDVVFSPGNPSEALEVATGRKKEPLQTMEGRWVNISPDDAYAEAVNIFSSPEWTQVGVDPTRHSYFYDKRNTQPVTKADEVIQIGRTVFAKNVQYAAKEEFLFSEGKPIVGRSDALKDAANQLQEGLITAQEYDSLVNQYKPIRVPQGVRTPNSREEVTNILKSNQLPMAFPDIPEGTRVGTRLDIDSTRKGVPVVSIHQPKPNINSAKQPIIGYDSVARLTDVQFAVGNQTRALKIAAGAFKEPLQTMEGAYSKISPEEAVAIAQSAINDPSWTQVGVDPERHAYFYDKKNTRPVVSADEVIQIGDQVFAKNVEYAPKEEFLFSQTLSNEDKGKMALGVVDALGRGAQPEKTNVQRLKEAILDDRGNVKITPENAKKAATRFVDQVETWAFSSDAALNNAIRRTINDTTMSQKEKLGVLLSISSSQAVHADAVASLFMRYGAVRYNPETYKYEAVDRDDNLPALVKAIDELAKTYNMTKEQAERVAHTAFEAKRLRSLQEFNEGVDAQVAEIKQRIAIARVEGDVSGKKMLENELRRTMRNYKFIHMTEDEINSGLSLIEMMPKEMQKIIDIWNGIRLNSAAELVRSGLWSVDEAEILLSNMDYVPFYREDQLEQGKGPKEFLRNLQVQAKEKKLKGSKLPVNDIFDNMARWTQYAVKRSVMNRLAVAKIDAAVDAGLAQKVSEAKKGKDSVRVWRDGNPEFYNLTDPMFMDAFAGLESVAIPAWKIASEFSSFLRQTVVLNPLFSLSQVPQDAFAAIYSSGLKPRFALSIPARAVKEFILTIAKASKTHKELERIGAVGIRDFSAAVARTDAEVTAGLRSRPGIWNKVKGALEHFSMASDNAVRQAVYEASIAQGLSRAEAMEKAFQIINFKNRGSSKALALAGQVIPFFNAYLAAQHVAIKTISGVGISPVDRKAALETLVYTTAAVMALSLIYSIMMDDDEDYKKTPSIIRDRLLLVPGVGMSIPLRPDVFAIPKIITEHTYMMLTNQGSADGRKFRDSMKTALGNALLSPTVVPQAIKPLVEVGINYNFYQGRPLVGTYQKGLETERQFNDSTAELAKSFGRTGVISPIAADHLIRGMLGSAGGLILFLTNGILHSDPSVPRPEMTVREAIASLPSTSGFVRREYETGLKNDFYVLRDEVSKAVNTLNDLKARSPHEIEEFLADEKNINRVGLQKATNKITQDLSKIRREISRITQLPASEMSAREKQQAIRELREIEDQMLSGIDIKELRRMAKL